MAITYDKKRTDITFCTMLFQIPRDNLNSLKHMDRKFEEFYLPNLKKLISKGLNPNHSLRYKSIKEIEAAVKAL